MIPGAASTALRILVKLASVQASRPFTHARYAPPTNCHPLTRLSCNRARPFPRESRSDHRLIDRWFPNPVWFYPFRIGPRSLRFHDAGLASASPSNLPRALHLRWFDANQPLMSLSLPRLRSITPHWIAVTPLVGARVNLVSSAEPASADLPWRKPV